LDVRFSQIIKIFINILADAPLNLGLSDMSKFFLDIDMDKTERVGNWTQRPLRYERILLYSHKITR